MNTFHRILNAVTMLVQVISFSFAVNAQQGSDTLRMIAFFTARNDQAHISFVHEANRWFEGQSEAYGFQYDSTNNWNNLNAEFLSRYRIVIFLDTRPESPDQRKAFQNYIEHGGAWLGMHFAGFALTPSDYPQNWDWYHNEFLGSGEYKSNTWRPTSAGLRIENPDHIIARDLPQIFRSSPNEWYCWKNDLRKNPDIEVLLSVDSSSFPLGTGPKPYEIWHSGDYPVVWTNRKYKMVYMNMGHNDIDYEHNSSKELSFTFGNELQDRLILNAIDFLSQ